MVSSAPGPRSQVEVCVQVGKGRSLVEIEIEVGPPTVSPDVPSLSTGHCEVVHEGGLDSDALEQVGGAEFRPDCVCERWGLGHGDLNTGL